MGREPPIGVVLQNALQNDTLCSKMQHGNNGGCDRKALFSRQKKLFTFGTAIALYTSIENETYSGESENERYENDHESV